jgi:hypothetical protein
MTDSNNRSKARSFSVLSEIEWSYPPADGIRNARDGGWQGAKRCPICFAEWNLARHHEDGCRLSEALKNDALAILKGK